MTREAHLAWEVGAQLGEGPVWVESDRALWFTDIKRQQVHRFDPESGEGRSWESAEASRVPRPREKRRVHRRIAERAYRFDPKKGKFKLLIEVEPGSPENRLNDGVVDPKGRLWFGTMDDSEKSTTGAYYCFHRGKLTRTNLTGIAITNGPAISPDGSILYWVDTLKGTISACEILGDGHRAVTARRSGQSAGRPSGRSHGR